MAMQDFYSANKLRVLLSCIFSFASIGGFAFEVSPYGSGSSRESDLQMQQAQEAIRSICSCVVGPGQGMNPMMSANCGPITSASLQQNPYGSPMGMPAMGANGQMPMMNGQPQMMMPGMNHNGMPGMQQMNPMMNGQPQMLPNQPGMFPSR